MADQKINIECVTNGFEEDTEQIECLTDAYDGFPAQVTINNCHHCTFNIHPSQTKFVERAEQEYES